MSALGCGYACVQVLLFIVNFFVWLVGCVLLAIGIWFLADANALRVIHVVGDTSEPLLRAAAIIIVIVGAVIFVIGALGCCGACRENSDCLLAFASILAILVVGQVVTAILAGVYRVKLLSRVVTGANSTLHNDYGNSNQTSVTEAWDFAQVELLCCGLNGPSDWADSTWMKTAVNKTIVPKSCCVLTNTDFRNPQPLNETLCYYDAVHANTSSAYVHTQGCQNSVTSWISGHVAIIIGVAVGLIAIQIIGVIMACCLGREVRNRGIIN